MYFSLSLSLPLSLSFFLSVYFATGRSTRYTAICPGRLNTPSRKFRQPMKYSWNFTKSTEYDVLINSGVQRSIGKLEPWINRVSLVSHSIR